MEGRTHRPELDPARCGVCGVCAGACPATFSLDLADEEETLRGTLAALSAERRELALPACRQACPLGQDIQGYIGRLAAGDQAGGPGHNPPGQSPALGAGPHLPPSLSESLHRSRHRWRPPHPRLEALRGPGPPAGGDPAGRPQGPRGHRGLRSGRPGRGLAFGQERSGRNHIRSSAGGRRHAGLGHPRVSPAPRGAEDRPGLRAGPRRGVEAEHPGHGRVPGRPTG